MAQPESIYLASTGGRKVKRVQQVPLSHCVPFLEILIQCLVIWCIKFTTFLPLCVCVCVCELFVCMCEVRMCLRSAYGVCIYINVICMRFLYECALCSVYMHECVLCICEVFMGYVRCVYMSVFCVIWGECVWSVYICVCSMCGMCVHVCCICTCVNWVCGSTIVCGRWEVGDIERKGKSRLGK